jgi:murein DD-endopeptidase MepM/ murein hydrolase activator NlpD
VYIECLAEKVQVLLAHMKQGSITVKAGETVHTGDPIGQVGNSGNTTEPHLHIHARVGGDLRKITSGTAIPISYDGRFYVRNNLYQP